MKILAVQSEVVGSDPDNPIAELAPGDDQRVRTLVIDPEESTDTLEYLILACTSYYGVSGCLEEIDLVDADDLENENLELDEEDYRKYIEKFTVRGTFVPDGLISVFEDSIPVADNFSALIDVYGYPEVDASLWVLVCKPGLCPIMDEVDTFLEEAPGAPSGETLFLSLQDPELLMAGAPIEGVSLARKRYLVSQTSDDNRNHNPRFSEPPSVECVPGEGEDGSGEECSIVFSFSDDVLETYLDNASTSLSTESIVLRYYSTRGEMIPFNDALSVSDDYRTTAILRLDEGDYADGVGIFATALDSRDGMGFSTYVIR